MTAAIPGTGPIGRSETRPQALRSVAGRGCYTDDIAVDRLAHVAFLRSPYPHARLLKVDSSAACEQEGVIAVLSGADILTVCKPWQTKLALLPAHISPPQPALVVDEACWQGEAVVAIVAETRSLAEDALELVVLEWEELPAATDIPGGPRLDLPKVHSCLSSNLAFEHAVKTGDIDAAFSSAPIVIDHRFSFGRQTGVTLEPRTIVARFDRKTRKLVVHQSHQVPFQMRDIYAEQLGLPVESVNVHVPDVGGAFGLKLHAYADEMALVAISVLVDRPVKFTADRLEAFQSDAHAREANVTARMAFALDGRILGLEVDIVAGLGAYSMYPRGSIGEAMQAVQMTGAPYNIGSYKGRVRGYYQNKAPTGAYRGVGQPIGCAIAEQLIDQGAAALGVDPAALRLLNYRKVDQLPQKTEGGIVVDRLSLDQCLRALLSHMDYDGQRREQARLRHNGVYRGIGLSTFVELTGVGPGLYGPQGVRVSAKEGCRLTLETSGTVRCETSITDQGQGTYTGIAQIVAEELGIAVESVTVAEADTDRSPYGGGAWASRGIAIGGEAALKAARRLQQNILTIAASLLQEQPEKLKARDGAIYGRDGHQRFTFAEISAICHFQPDLVPMEELPPLEVLEQFVLRSQPYIATNGIQASLLEVDCETGIITLLKHWAVDDCGRIINPMLVDEQIRGGIVQGIGAALYEHCLYSEEGSFQTGTLADYLVPMASEMPDIEVLHLATPTRATQLGAKGVGEAGTVGALGAIWTAVNDALRPLGSQVTNQPFTPEHILDVIAAGEAAAREKAVMTKP